MKCPICRTKKGKRFCPIENSLVCPSCCGKRIHNRFKCPQDCAFLVSSREYRKNKTDIKAHPEDIQQQIDGTIVSLFERNIYDRLKKDRYYEDHDLLQGIERKIQALENPAASHEILLNRSGVIESALDEVIKRARIEDQVRFSNERILRDLRAYARLVRHLGSTRKGGRRYVQSLKERMAEKESEPAQERSNGQKMPGDSLISLPFSQ